MGNASDASDIFLSKISKEHDILVGSIYSVFCKLAARRGRLLSRADPNGVLLCPPPRSAVPHGQLRSAPGCVPQALDAEAGRVLHHQSLHQRPRDDAHLVSLGDTLVLFAQVCHNVKSARPWDGCELWLWSPSHLHLLLTCEQVAVRRDHLSALRHVRRAVWPV